MLRIEISNDSNFKDTLAYKYTCLKIQYKYIINVFVKTKFKKGTKIGNHIAKTSLEKGEQIWIRKVCKMRMECLKSVNQHS